MIRLYHVQPIHENDPRIWVLPTQESVQQHMNEGAYKEVALIDALSCDTYEDDLEVAWRLANSIDAAWYENTKTVVAYLDGAEGLRSSMVGDIYIKDDGTAWFVSTIGFERVDSILLTEPLATKLEPHHVDRCIETMRDWGNLSIPTEVMREILSKEDSLCAKLLMWYRSTGDGLDTAERDLLNDAVAKNLGAERWPRYGDSEDFSRAFHDRLINSGWLIGDTDGD